jgi:hypothetical protein
MTPRTDNASAVARLAASDLVAAGLLRPDDEASAARVLDEHLTIEPAPASHRPGAGRLAAEVAGYLGGILVVAAAAVFLASQWQRMEEWTRVLALLLAATVLGVAAVAVRRTVPAVGSVSELARQARLLLAGTLGVGAAAVAGGAAGVWGMQILDLTEPVPQRIGFMVACVLMIAVYVLTRTAVAHLGIAVTAALSILTIVMTMNPPDHANLILAGLLIALAAVWVVLTERGILEERVLGQAVAGTLAIIGAQTAIEDGDMWLAYLLLAVVGIIAFVLYARTLDWPYLGVGVVALTLAATEAAVDLTDGALGAAGALLVAGAALLTASAVGLRLRHQA